ncbi:MAG: IS66 family transposase [Candidatus Eremiobacteraeota bacterium]|nr:IS66 family transposase [Candidatus Eremiobacteraeota bacterium]
MPTDLAAAHALILSQRERLIETQARADLAESERTCFRLEVERLKLLLAKARRAQFGQTSERGKQIIEQLELAISDLEETQAEIEAKAEIAAPPIAERRRSTDARKPARRPLPDHLPRERVVHPAPCTCGKCGGIRLRKLGEIVTETLECEPRRWKVVQHVRETMTCRDCEGVSETPAPSHPIARGRAGPHLLALVLASKYGAHLPLNRQSEIYAREGAAIEVSTLADWVGACAASLEPLIARIRAHVFAAERIHADDTTVPILAKCRTTTGRLWTYVRDDRPFGGPDPPAAVFHASRHRTGAHPERHLAGFSGIMQADAYAGFNGLYASTRKPQPIVEAACFAHARRKLFDLAKVAKAPIAIEAVAKIDVLFAIEREINGKSAAERLAVRRERLRPLVDDLQVWLIAQRAKLSPRSELAKAITYSLKRWDALTRFLDDGRICMTNNAAERALRGVALGRANWTFAGSDRGAERAAAIYTLIATCKLNGVDPQAYLADVLARLPDHPARRIDDLMPWRWQPLIIARAA